MIVGGLNSLYSTDMNVQVVDKSDCDCPVGEQDIVCTNFEHVCRNCGRVVVSHIIDESPEWFESENARANWSDMYYSHASEQGHPMHKSLKEALTIVKNFAQTMRLSSIVCTKATELYIKFYEATVQQHRRLMYDDRIVSAACCLYFACKMAGASRSVREISRACRVAEPSCVSMMKQIKQTLPDIRELFITVTAADLLTRSLQELSLTSAQFHAVLKTCHRVHHDIGCSLEGKTPECVCAVCIYWSLVVHGITETTKNIAMACMISPMTLSKTIPLVNFQRDDYVLKPTNE